MTLDDQDLDWVDWPITEVRNLSDCSLLPSCTSAMITNICNGYVQTNALLAGDAARRLQLKPAQLLIYLTNTPPPAPAPATAQNASAPPPTPTVTHAARAWPPGPNPTVSMMHLTCHMATGLTFDQKVTT